MARCVRDVREMNTHAYFAAGTNPTSDGTNPTSDVYEEYPNL